MKVNKIMVALETECYKLDMKISIKDEVFAPTQDILEYCRIMGTPELIPIPILMAVIHDLLVDIGDKTGQELPMILELIKAVDEEYPVKFGKGKGAKYGLR